MSRLIDADETIRRLHEYLSKIEDRYQNADTEFWRDRFTVTMDVIRVCMDYVRNTPTVNEWIPCSERLPEERERVLVYIDRPANQICVSQRTDVTYWIGLGHVNVVAWMPLPKPYEVR